jgi:hypothetical protein
MLRKGQEAFNKLWEENPAVASAITGTEFDPFYDDSKLEAFYKKVEELTNLQKD